MGHGWKGLQQGASDADADTDMAVDDATVSLTWHFHYHIPEAWNCCGGRDYRSLVAAAGAEEVGASLHCRNGCSCCRHNLGLVAFSFDVHRDPVGKFVALA